MDPMLAHPTLLPAAFRAGGRPFIGGFATDAAGTACSGTGKAVWAHGDRCAGPRKADQKDGANGVMT